MRFAPSQFRFSDAGDDPPDAFQAVRIAALPSAGVLLLGNDPVSIGQFVSVANIADGRLQYQPPSHVNGSGIAAFSFQVQDDGGTAEGGVDLDPTPNTLRIDLIAVNDPPDGTDGSVALAEDTDYVFAAADFGYSDPHDIPPHSLVAVWIASLPDFGQLLLGGNPVQVGDAITVQQLNAGLLRFVPDPDANGLPLTSFLFQVQDDGGLENGGQSLDPEPNELSIIVTPVNDAPVARPDGGFVFENGILEVPAATGLLANDIDIDQGDELRVVSIFGEMANVGTTITLTSGALLLVRPDGSYRYDPNGQYETYARFQSTFDGFTYELSDVAGEVATASVTITIIGENDAPTALDDSFTLDEDTPLEVVGMGVLANDSDVELGFLLAAPVELPAHGELILRMDGTFIYTPAADFAGTDRFTYRASDGDLVSEVATVTLTVRPVNDRPELVMPPLQMLVEGESWAIVGLFTDQDPTDSWTATVDYGDGSGVTPLALAPDKTFVLSHVYRDNGNYQVTVAVRDSGGLVATDSSAIEVANAPPANVVITGPSTAAQGSRVVFSGSFRDAGLADTFSGVISWGDGQSTAFTASPATGLTFAEGHVYAAAGQYQVSVIVTDDDGGSAAGGPAAIVVVAVANPGAVLRSGILEISGTDRSDNIAVTVSGNRILVNGTYGGANIRQSFAKSNVRQIIASLEAGDDAFSLDAKLRTALIVRGGSGNDRLRAGGGPALLAGEEGSDLLYGSSGRDVLIGGGGRDQLWGYGGSDLLTSGQTTYDRDSQALSAIFAEWSSGRAFKARVANLRGGTGPVLSGTGIRLESGSTVLDDGVVDSLMGNGDSDWFFARQDKLNDKAELLN